MSNQFLKLRRSAIQGRKPTTSSLELGEIALNTYDGLAFMKKSGSSGEEIVTLGTGGGNMTGSQYFVPVFNTTSSLVTSSIFDSASFTAIGATAPVDPNNPDRLFVEAGNTTSYNLISGHGEVDSYLQLNIQNFSPGSTGSSDIVATANNGDETDFYIDMGINGSGYNDSEGIGAANDSYLYNTGGDLLIGNVSTNKRVIIFNGGQPALDNARIYVTSEGSVGINASDVNNTNPETLLVEPLTGSTATDFNNLIIGRGTIHENYLQLNITNKGTGSLASSDIVATNDIGNETSYYIDMGVNSSGFNTPNAVGTASDAYLYSTAEHLHIGNASANMPIMFFAGGLDSEANRKFELWPDNQHIMSGSLDITGSLRVLEGITGSLFGTASWANNTLTASYVNPLVQDVQITGSLFISGSQTITGSLRLAVSNTDSFLFSNTDNVLNYTTSNSSYRRWTATNTSPSGAAAIGFLFYNDLSDLFQFYHGSSNNTSITPRQSMMRASGTGGLRLTADSGPIVFHAGSYGTERARFDTTGRLLIGLTTGSTGYLLEVNSGGRFIGNVLVTGSVTATQGFTGSLFGTASWAQNAVTASYADNFTVAGTLTAQTIVVQTITSSTDFVTGSTRFGSLLSNTHQFTGSVSITGSLTSPNITGSLQGTASWASNALTASYQYPIAVTGSTLYSVSPATSIFSTNNSIFLGEDAGYSASNASDSNFLGNNAGKQAINANNSNFLGISAGDQATNAYESNFIGSYAGRFSTDANYSNFLGFSAGYNASFANESNFLGNSAGENAYTASYSNFIGYYAGNNARSASYSNFIGQYAGYNAASASFSTFMGRQAGASFNGTTAGSVGRNNIVIGHNITFTAGRQDSINLGAIIFATGSYFADNYTMFTGTVGNGRVGINVVNPRYNFDVSGSGNFTNGLTITGSVIATSFTGSLSGSATSALTASYVNPLVQNVLITGSLFVSSSNATQFLVGTGSLFVSSSGQVGIGTTTPTSGFTLDNTGSFRNYGQAAFLMNTGDAGGGNAAVGLGILPASVSRISGERVLMIQSYYSTIRLSDNQNYNFEISLGTPRVPVIGTTNAQPFDFQINGSRIIRVQSTGNFTIGTTTDAGYKLDVNGTSRFSNNMIVSGAATINGTAIVYRVEKNQADQSNPLQFYVAYNHINPRIEFWGGQGARLWYNTNTLSLHTDTASAIDLGTPTLGFGNVYSNTITTNTSSYFAVVSGSVGIGKTTPNAKLDVSGSAIITGSLTVTQGITGSLSGSATSALTASYVTTLNQDVTITGSLGVGGYVTASRFGSGIASPAAPFDARVTTTNTGFLVNNGLQQTGINAYGSSIYDGSGIVNYNNSSGNAIISTTTAKKISLQPNSIETLAVTTGSVVITGSLTVSGSANIVAAVTASTALISGSGTNRLTIIGSGSAQPIFTVQGSQGELFSITDSLSGSLFSVNDISGLPILEVFSDNTTLQGSYLAPALNTTNKVTTTNSGSFYIYGVPTASYDGLFVDYTAKSGSAARAGQFMAIWSGSSVNYTDNSTTDFGNTTALTLTGSISGSNMIITGNVTTGSGWVVKAIIRSI